MRIEGRKGELRGRVPAESCPLRWVQNAWYRATDFGNISLRLPSGRWACSRLVVHFPWSHNDSRLAAFIAGYYALVSLLPALRITIIVVFKKLTNLGHPKFNTATTWLGNEIRLDYRKYVASS